jgi:hypothetical protein
MASSILAWMPATATSATTEDRDSPDWIEIGNGSGAAVNLEGYGLSDDSFQPLKWRFPAVTLGPGEYRVVFASGKNRRVPGQPLHTSFQLSSAGEDLILTAPDGWTRVHGWTSAFVPAPPGQPVWTVAEPNVSQGLLGGEPRLFPVPTPGQANLGRLDSRGAVIDLFSPAPSIGSSGTDRVVSARLRADLARLSTNVVVSARVHARVMDGPEQSLALNDAGLEGDLVAGDGLWSATLPAARSFSRARFTTTPAPARPATWSSPPNADRLYFRLITPAP